MQIRQPGPLTRPTVCMEASLCSVGRREKSIFKRKCIKLQTGQFHFLSPARLRRPPIHLSVWSIYARVLINNSSTPGHGCFSAPQKQLHERKIIVNSEEHKLRSPPETSRRPSSAAGCQRCHMTGVSAQVVWSCSATQEC